MVVYIWKHRTCDTHIQSLSFVISYNQGIFFVSLIELVTMINAKHTINRFGMFNHAMYVISLLLVVIWISQVQELGREGKSCFS